MGNNPVDGKGPKVFNGITAALHTACLASETDMKPYTPSTPRAAFAIAAVTIAAATLVALGGMPTFMDTPDAAATTARARGAIVVRHARTDIMVAGEMYAAANSVPTVAVR